MEFIENFLGSIFVLFSCVVFNKLVITLDFRVSTDLENLGKSGYLSQNTKNQGEVREFRHVKFIFSQSEDPNVETFLGEHA